MHRVAETEHKLTKLFFPCAHLPVFLSPFRPFFNFCYLNPSPCSSFIFPFLDLRSYLSPFDISFPLSFCPCSPVPTDVLHGETGHHEGDGERGENDGKSRTEQEKHHFGGGGDELDDDSVAAAATAASVLFTNPLPSDALLPSTSSTHGPLELINHDSLGKVAAECVCGSVFAFILTFHFNNP